MARLYADEDFPLPAVGLQRQMSHDVLFARDAGQAGQGIGDPDVLAFANGLGRALITHNRRHFVRLHRSGAAHWGIIVCTADLDFQRLAGRIHAAIEREIAAHGTLAGRVVRVYRPST